MLSVFNIELFVLSFLICLGSATAIEEVTDNDVIMGMSQCHRHHPGNIFVNSLVKQNFQSYQSCLPGNKITKGEIIDGIVHSVSAHGGRFLEGISLHTFKQVDYQTARISVTRRLIRATEKSYNNLPKVPPQQPLAGATITPPPNQPSFIHTRKGKKTINTVSVCDSAYTVPDLLDGCVLSIHPNVFPGHLCDEIREQIMSSGLLRQYRVNNNQTEPRRHFLLHEHATDGDMLSEGPGYGYHGVCMRGQPFTAVPLMPFVDYTLKQITGVDCFELGADTIVYDDGDDSINWHADDNQGESLIACVVIETPPDRKIDIRVKEEYRESDADDVQYQLEVSKGSVYIMNGVMQQKFEHRVPKSKNSGTRIVIAFRDGTAKTVMDNGVIASAPRTKLPKVQFGPVRGIEEGKTYGRPYLRDVGAHRADRRGISGNNEQGCDSIVVARMDPNKGESDCECVVSDCPSK